MARKSFSSGSWQDGISSTRSSLSSTSSDPTDNFPTTIIDKHTDRVPWIINHVLECHLSSELPLKIMFSFNAGHRVPTLKEAHKWWQYEPKGTAIIHFLISLEKSTPENKEDSTSKPGNVKENEISEAEVTKEDKSRKPDDVKDENIKSTIRNHAAYDPFMDASNEALLDIDFESELPDGRRANRGLPPDFIRKWCLDRVFTKDEDQADFDQALTGIDYLQDLECRRREALREVALRLKIDKHNWRRVLSADPDAKKWVEDIQAQETIIEGFYATCFVDLRIWTMLHELKAHPFYKPNALAMLNTLYPPCIRDLPNDRIDRDKLRKHRAKFYNLIIQVTHEGIEALKEFETLLKNPACKHNWVDTRENLRDYIELASKMIEQSNAIHDIMFFKRSAAIAYSIRSAHSRNTTASSSTSARTELQSDQKEKSVTVKNTAFDSEKPAPRHHSQSTTGSRNSKEDTSHPATSNSMNEPQKSDRAEAKVHSRKRLASPKRQHEYREEYHTIPMNAPRTPCSVVTTPKIPDAQSFSSSRSSNGDGRGSVHSQQRILQLNTPFMEQFSEAAHHSSFQTWVPLKDQQKMSPFRLKSFPDPWSRGPPKPKYQLRPQKLSEDEKLLRVLCRPEAPVERRASFPNGVPSSSSRARTSSFASKKVKSRRMYKDGGATSVDTLRAGSSTHVSQHGSSTGLGPMKQVEHVLKDNSDAIKAYQALDLRELPGYPSTPKAIIPENTHRPPLHTQKSCGTFGGLRSRALSGASSMAVSPLISQQVTPVIGASRKLQLRKTPLRDFTTDLESESHPASREHTFPLPQATSAISTPRIKLRKTPLHDAADAEMQTPSPLPSISQSPLSMRQGSPITPTPGTQLHRTALHNSSIEDQTPKTSLSTSKAPIPSPLNLDTLSPRTETRQKPKKLMKSRPYNDLQCEAMADRATKNITSVARENPIDAVAGDTFLPQISPSANLSFLASPYEPSAVFQPRLRKKSSMATVVCRKSIESLKSVRFEDTETCQENTTPKTPRQSSERSKTPRKSSESSKSTGIKSGDNALGISIPNANSTTTFSRLSPITPTDSCVNFPPPPLPKQILKKQKSLGLFPRRGSEPANDTVDLPERAILKKQKSLGLFPRRDCGKEKDKSTQSALTSKSQDMGGIFDGSQQNCTAYSAHTATACREPYRFPVPSNRIPINQDDASQSFYSPAEAAKTPIIKESSIISKPVIRVNTARKSSAISNPSPISPANKVYGFIPPPLKKQISFGGWETDLDIALEHEHRLKLEHAKAQIPSQQLMKHRVSIDKISSKESNESNPLQLKKTASKLSKTASFADDEEQMLQAPTTPSSGKFGKLFMNAGANISAIFVGKSATTPNLLDLQGKSQKVPVSILSKKEGKEKSVSEKDGTVGRQHKTGTLATLLNSFNPSRIFSKRSHHNKSSLSHKHKLVSYRRREQILRKHFRLQAHTLQRYKKQMVLEDGQGILYAEGIKWLDRYKPFVRESPEVYRRKEWMRSWLLEGARAEKEGLRKVSGAPFLKDASVRVGVKKGGRDTRRRVFEGFVARDVRGVRGRRDRESGVERILEKIDWRKEGWFEEPRAKRARAGKKGENGEGGKKGERKKHIMISTEKYDRY
ncbi:uncharacterized protein EAE98_000223 [Botrytis deweyae]|uniref:HAUS augmin-like complex subunit 6 N-terminal domain-containing protein n=1 Tax=Botrytis deweyae TaxID=2478750 RepID=A0ABQ7J236_9HELO|nr:uncharacterized protein EAE98_000223 [Botrytis deweyae]KAF7940096.1 hypothetical protein EAE98_000223 [Botrytis deweyae]